MHVDSLLHNLQGLNKIIEALSTHKHNACIIRYTTKVLYYWCLYNICTDVSKTLSNNRLSPLTQQLPHSDITTMNNPLTHSDTLHYL